MTVALNVEAGAKGPANTGEVTLTTLAGWPVSTSGPGVDVPILLNGQSSFTFTQKAGHAVQVIATAVNGRERRHVLQVGCDRLWRPASGSGLWGSESAQSVRARGIRGLAAQSSDTSHGPGARARNREL